MIYIGHCWGKYNYKIVPRSFVMLKKTTDSYEIVERYNQIGLWWPLKATTLIAKDEQKDNYKMALGSFDPIIVP